MTCFIADLFNTCFYLLSSEITMIRSILYWFLTSHLLVQFTLFALGRTYNWHQLNIIPSYNSRCESLNIKQLRTRRDHITSMLVCNVLSSRINSPFILGELSIYVPSRQLRNYMLLQIPFRRTNYALNEPIFRMHCSENCLNGKINDRGIQMQKKRKSLYNWLDDWLRYNDKSYWNIG